MPPNGQWVEGVNAFMADLLAVLERIAKALEKLAEE